MRANEYTNWIRVRRLEKRAERFENWEDAIDAAVERDRPIFAKVVVPAGVAIAKVFPSRNVVMLSAAVP